MFSFTSFLYPLFLWLLILSPPSPCHRLLSPYPSIGPPPPQCCFFIPSTSSSFYVDNYLWEFATRETRTFNLKAKVLSFFFSGPEIGFNQGECSIWKIILHPFYIWQSVKALKHGWSSTCSSFFNPSHLFSFFPSDCSSVIPPSRRGWIALTRPRSCVVRVKGCQANASP